MPKDAGELARDLTRVQARLRRELVEELQGHAEDLESIFDPYSYSPIIHELREKYLTRLYLIHGLIQQLAHHAQGNSKPTTRVLRVGAADQRKLVQQVNRQLAKLNGAKVLDVKFIPATADEQWSALITFEMNPFAAAADETAAWM